LESLRRHKSQRSTIEERISDRHEQQPFSLIKNLYNITLYQQIKGFWGFGVLGFWGFIY
jgi:hypothetical protein